MPALPRLSALAALLLLLSSCSNNSHGTWWCADSGRCFATKASCQEELAATGIDGTCKQQSIAYCKLTCSLTGLTRSGAPVCREECGVDEPACDDFDSLTPTRCQPMKPPEKIALFPDYSSPGWWCRRVQVPLGQASQCVKAKEQCEWYVRDAESKVGAPQSSCEAKDDVFCFSLKTNGDLEYQCAMSLEDCDTFREAVQATASNSPVSMTAFSKCAPWKFTAELRGRAVPRPKKNRPAGLTLVFAVTDDNPDPIRTVKMMRSRLDLGPGVPASDVELGENEIFVHLPPDLGADAKDVVVKLLTREASWTAHRVVEDRPVIEALAAWTKAAPDAAGLGIEVRADPSGLPYLFAANREAAFSVAEAKERGCWNHHMNEFARTVPCHVSGSEVLHRVVGSYLASDIPPELGSASDHLFRYARTTDGWRSHCLEREPILSSGDLSWAEMGWDPDRERPLAALRWSPASKAKGSWVMTKQDTVLAILVENRDAAVSAVVRPVRLYFGMEGLVVEPSSAAEATEDGLAAATHDLVELLRAGLPMGVTFESASP